MIILDTNVLSELMRPEPSQQVATWVRSQEATAITAVTVAEILYGIARLPRGRRRSTLGSAATALFAAHAEATFSFTVDEAPHYAAIAASREQAGKPIEDVGAQIASICRRHQVPLATRNVKDFENTGVLVVNPWADPEQRA